MSTPQGLTPVAISPVEDIVADMKAGRIVILVDEEDRENEGDLVLAADHVTPEAINFMARFGRGLICLTLTRERCEFLKLPPMAASNGTVYSTAFTVSIEAAEGVTTGISAADRARTALADRETALANLRQRVDMAKGTLGTAENAVTSNAALQGTLASTLDHRAIGHGIRERHAQFDDVGTALHQCMHQAQGVRGLGETGHQIRDQRFAALGFQRGKRRSDAAHAAAPFTKFTACSPPLTDWPRQLGRQ